jgi:hypothetical protein
MMPTIRPGNTPRSSVAAAGIARTIPIAAVASGSRSVVEAGSGSCMYISTITRR